MPSFFVRLFLLLPLLLGLSVPASSHPHDVLGADCASLPPNMQANCRKKNLGSDCSSLPPKYRADCWKK